MYFRSFPKSSGERFNALVARPFGGVADEVFADGAFPATAFSAEAGAVALAVADAGIVRGSVFHVEQGSVTVSGAAIAAGVGRALDVGMGSILVSGPGIAAPVGRTMPASPAMLFVTGGASDSLLVSREMNAGTGAFLLTGPAAGLVASGAVQNVTLDASPGAVNFAWQDVRAPVDRPMIAASGAVAVVIADVGTLSVLGMVADGDAYSMTGAEVGASAQRPLAGLAVAWGVSGRDAGMVVARTFDASPGEALVAVAQVSIEPVFWHGPNRIASTASRGSGSAVSGGEATIDAGQPVSVVNCDTLTQVKPQKGAAA